MTENAQYQPPKGSTEPKSRGKAKRKQTPRGQPRGTGNRPLIGPILSSVSRIRMLVAFST